MYGAILGDMIGSPYEFNNHRLKDFPLFSRKSTFTDDSLMTLAVAKGFMDAGLDADNSRIRTCIVTVMVSLARRYPNCGFGTRFQAWLSSKDHVPYHSFGNGSAMRVSSVAWFYHDIGAVRHAAQLSADVSHDHPEGIKGAESVASAIFLARTGSRKEEIKHYIESEFGYDLGRTCDRIRATAQFDETCPGSVPEAIIAFLEGEGFEDVVRTAVSIGGDSDTIACIAGSIAEAYYGVPFRLKLACYRRLPLDLRGILFKAEVRKQRDVRNLG